MESYSKNKKKFNKNNKTSVSDLRKKIEEFTQKIQKEKNTNRLMKERLSNVQQEYNELKSKTKQIQPNKKLFLKQTKNVSNNKNKHDFGKYTDDINDLISSNQFLRNKIENLRKQKLKLLNKKNIIIEKNKKKEDSDSDDENDNQLKINKNQLIEINELNSEYQKILKKYIAKENINSLSVNEKTPLKNPVLEQWRVVNDEKRECLEKYMKNCHKIRRVFEYLIVELEVKEINDLISEFKKLKNKDTEMNNKKNKLNIEIEKMENEKIVLKDKIDHVDDIKYMDIKTKNNFIKEKLETIKVNQMIIDLYTTKIQNKENFIKEIKPCSLDFINKLNKTYISDYVIKKNFNEKNTIDNIVDYFDYVNKYTSLIYNWINKNNASSENNNYEKLRDEIIKKVIDFEEQRKNKDDNVILNNDFSDVEYE